MIFQYLDLYIRTAACPFAQGTAYARACGTEGRREVCLQVFCAAKGTLASALGFLMKGKLKRWHGAQRADLREE